MIIIVCFLVSDKKRNMASTTFLFLSSVILSSASCSELLLVTTGWPSIDTRQSEVIDLADANRTCQPLPSFSYPVSGATGGLLGNEIVICGGKSNNVTYDNCQGLGSNSTMKMHHSRYLASSVVVACRWWWCGGNVEALWITGGSTYESQTTTEFVHSGGILGGESLPYAMTQHCVVKLNDSTVLFIGGFNTSSSYFHTFTENFYGIWSEGPSLSKPRHGHACGIFEQGDQTLIYVTGGSTSNDEKEVLKSTEVLELSNVHLGWRFGSNLPDAHYGGSIVSLGDRILLKLTKAN